MCGKLQLWAQACSQLNIYLCGIQVIPEHTDGRGDLAALESALLENAGAPLQLGCFSAASNVTGILANVHALAALLRTHGAISAFDYAAAVSCSDIQCRRGWQAAKQSRAVNNGACASSQDGAEEKDARDLAVEGVQACHLLYKVIK